MARSSKVRQEVLARDNYECQRCGRGRIKELEVHHVKALADGGLDQTDNAIALCRTCHREWHLVEEVSSLPFSSWLLTPRCDQMAAFWLQDFEPGLDVEDARSATEMAAEHAATQFQDPKPKGFVRNDEFTGADLFTGGFTVFAALAGAVLMGGSGTLDPIEQRNRRLIKEGSPEQTLPRRDF